MSGTAFYTGLGPKMVKQTCDRGIGRAIIDYPAVLTQDLGTGTSLTRPCRCSRQMTQGTRPGSSDSCTRSMKSTGWDWGPTRICTSGRQPTTTSSGRTFGTTPESLATRANTSSIPQQRQLRTLPGSQTPLSIFPRTFSRIVLRTPQPSSKSVRYCPIHSPRYLAINFAPSRANFQGSQPKAHPHLQRTALLSRGRCGVGAAPVWTCSG